MVCGSIMPGFDSLCNCCGQCGMCCCPAGNEKYCDWCNHCCCFGRECCECCPCGANGCIGFPHHLCVCCGNCNIFWYSSCCFPCAVADLYIATYGIDGSNYEASQADSWSHIVCTFVTFSIIVAILQALPRIIGASISLGRIFEGVAGILEMIVWIYALVIFGYAAGKIAKHKGLQYEPEDCCNACYNDGCPGCCGNCMKGCTSCQCCCAYYCCFSVHFDQVARVLETDKALQDQILKGRPDTCKCCNCWETAVPLELTTGSGSAMA